MNQLTDIYALLPIWPELLLACGAMLLLMIGVYSGEGSARFVNGLCIVLLIAVGALVVWLPAGRTEMFGGSFVVDDFARFLKLADADRLGRRAAAVARLSDRREIAEIRVRRAGAAGDARHDAADLGLRSDRALSRPRNDEPAALRGGGVEPR